MHQTPVPCAIVYQNNDSTDGNPLAFRRRTAVERRPYREGRNLLRPPTRWWRRGDSNSRPSRCERDALPTELLPRGGKRGIVYHTPQRPARGFSKKFVEMHGLTFSIFSLLARLCEASIVSQKNAGLSSGGGIYRGDCPVLTYLKSPWSRASAVAVKSKDAAARNAATSCPCHANAPLTPLSRTTDRRLGAGTRPRHIPCH